MADSTAFGIEPLSKLLRQQAIPASIGILVMSINGIVDTIFVGRYVGALGIGAVTVVMPISFLISSIGMAIGVGGASIISRSLGEKNMSRATNTFGNQIVLTLFLASLFVVLGMYFQESILRLFGGRGDIYEPASQYFQIVLYGVPLLAWIMMSNNVIRAIGYPKMAMLTLLVPAFVNLILDPIFIIYYGWGIKGAAWATTLSFVASACYTTWFFFVKQKELKLSKDCFRPNITLIKEMTALGSVTLARQGTISVLSIVINGGLFTYGGEMALSTYGIINRVMMFANFPVLGITQGFVPIVGYNFGAKLLDRVKAMVTLSIKSATVIAFVIFSLIMIFTEQLVSVFTTDLELIALSVPALRFVFLATPLIALNLLGSAYFQAIGKARPALLLTLTKQGFFLIPLVAIFPFFFGLNGIWWAFPIADTGAALITLWFLKQELSNLNQPS
ncbi:MAG: MATE family efflux transporter [Bacteroidia bacterium]|nr:MATE family efflux transporter [Bacteroidia bacterium]